MPPYPTARASVSRLSCLEVVPLATIEWKPEQAPQAIVMKSTGKRGGVAPVKPKRSACETAGATIDTLPLSPPTTTPTTPTTTMT
jgi:hypothetical protein